MLTVRKIITLLLLAVCSDSDIKERCIYMLPLGIAALLGIILSVADIIINYLGNTYLLQFFLLHCIFLPVAIGIYLYSFSVISNEALGRGDAILIAVLTVILEMTMVIKIIIIAIFTSAIFGVCMMINRKAVFREGIPFVPFVLFAYLFMLVDGYK